jgi:uncharacterized OB-fold protein
MTAYPQPRQDADNAAFLAAWKEGRLLLQSCTGCGTTFFYPRSMCPSCWSTALKEITASGKGSVVSYSVIWRPTDPAFNDEVPILLAEVAVEEGATLIARIINIDHEKLHSGMAVTLPPTDVARRYPLPIFQPSTAP